MQESPAGEGLLDVSQAATRLHVSRSYLYQLVEAKAIEHVRLGRRLLFTEAQLQAYVLANTVKAEPMSEAGKYLPAAGAAGAPVAALRLEGRR